MKKAPSRIFAACAALAAASLAGSAMAQPAGVEAKADKLLRAMTTYMAGLKQFSVKTENSIEMVTAGGQKIEVGLHATEEDVIDRGGPGADVDDASEILDPKRLVNVRFS